MATYSGNSLREIQAYPLGGAMASAGGNLGSDYEVAQSNNPKALYIIAPKTSPLVANLGNINKSTDVGISLVEINNHAVDLGQWKYYSYGAVNDDLGKIHFR